MGVGLGLSCTRPCSKGPEPATLRLRCFVPALASAMGRRRDSSPRSQLLAELRSKSSDSADVGKYTIAEWVSFEVNDRHGDPDDYTIASDRVLCSARRFHWRSYWRRKKVGCSAGKMPVNRVMIA